MRTYAVKLIFGDGSTKVIRGTIAKDFRLCDRAVVRLRSVIKNLPIQPRRIDRELILLHECVSVEEPEGSTFAETKGFIDVLDKISTHFRRGTLRGLEARKWKQ